MIILKNSRAGHGQRARGFSGSAAASGEAARSSSNEEMAILMDSYVRAWEAAETAGRRHALPGIERMIIDIFVESGAKLNEEARDLIRSATAR